MGTPLGGPGMEVTTEDAVEGHGTVVALEAGIYMRAGIPAHTVSLIMWGDFARCIVSYIVVTIMGTSSSATLNTIIAAGGASLLWIDLVENFAQNLKYSEVSVLHSGKRPRTNIVSLLYAFAGSYPPLS